MATGTMAQAIAWGVRRAGPDEAITMPSFGHGFSNVEIAAVANYVTARFGAVHSSISAQRLTDIWRQASR